MNDDSAIEIEGICSYPVQPEDYEGTYYTKSEMEEKLTEMEGQPILEEHSGKQIGKVKGGVIEDGQINAFIEISRDTIEGIRAISNLRDGTLKGLSIGHEFLIEKPANRFFKPKMRGKKIIEISLTSNPDCPTALIKNVGPDSEVWIAKTNFLTKKLRNENLKTKLYKSIKVLQDIGRPRDKMTDAAPETQKTEEVPAKDEKATDLNEKAKELEENNMFLSEELHRLQDLFGGPEQMKMIVQEHQKKKEMNQEKAVKDRKIIEEWMTVLSEKEPDKINMLKEAREQLDKDATNNGGVLLKYLGLAKARAENSQSEIERAFQESTTKAINATEELKIKKRKYFDDFYQQPPKETSPKEPPQKKQKISEDKSFDKRWSIGLPPPEWRGKVTTPKVSGAQSFMTKENYKSVFG